MLLPMQVGSEEQLLPHLEASVVLVLELHRQVDLPVRILQLRQADLVGLGVHPKQHHHRVLVGLVWAPVVLKPKQLVAVEL